MLDETFKMKFDLFFLLSFFSPAPISVCLHSFSSPQGVSSSQAGCQQGGLESVVTWGQWGLGLSRKGMEASALLGGVYISRRKGLSEAGRDSGNRKELKIE